MFNLTDLDLRYADHAARVVRVGREGWWRGAEATTDGRRPRGTATIVRSVRRHLGSAVIRIGVWLQESPMGHSDISTAS